MKINFRFYGMCFMFLLTLFSCSRQEEMNSKEELGLEEHQEDHLQGHKKINDYQVSYKVTSKDLNFYQAEVIVNDKRVFASVDYTREFVEIDGNNVMLSKKEKETLLLLGEELSQYLFKDGSVDNFTMAEFTLLRLLEYWAKSPNNYRYQKIVIKGSRTNLTKGNDDGITCIRKNTYVTAEYDNSNGREYNDRKLVNGERCLGRCGSGCPGVFTLASAWTKDCLDHDQCGRVLGGSTNPFDRNCGDEYAQAADDFLFGVLRGCRG